MSLTVQWSVQRSSFNSIGFNALPKIAMDSQGSVYITYQTDNVVTGQTFCGGLDIVIFKLDRSGVLQWVVQQPTFNTPNDDSCPDIIIDSMDNIYVSYQTSGTVSSQTHSGTGTDIVVVKLDQLYGDVKWIVQNSIINTDSSDTRPSIDIDEDGYIYVGYCTKGGTASGQTASGFNDIVIFKLEPILGRTVWIVQQPSFDALNCINSNVTIKVGITGYIYGAYQTTGTVSGQTYIGGLGDIVVFKLDATTGQCVWVAQQPTFDTKGYDRECCLGLDYDDNIYVVYYTDHTVSGQTYTGGANDLVIVKLEPIMGQCQWVRQNPSFNTIGDDTMPCIVISDSGYLFITYQTNGTVSNQYASYTGGDHDIVIFKIDPVDGQLFGVNQLPTFNTTGDDINPRILVDPAGDVYLTYQTSGQISEIGSTITGINDIVVFRMTPPQPQIVFTEYYGVLDLPPGTDVPTIGTYITYTYTVQNTGGLPVYDVMIYDNLGTEGLLIGDLYPNQIGTVTSHIYQIIQDDIEKGRVESQATADGTYYDATASAYSETTVYVKQVVQLAVAKNTISADTFIGGRIRYEIVVHNSGNVSFHNLVLIDPKCGFQASHVYLETLQTWSEYPDLLITKEIYEEFHVVNDITVTGLDSENISHTYTAENITTLCLLGDSMVELCDGSYKNIKDIVRGDMVAPGHKVARLCQLKVNPYLVFGIIEIQPNSLGSNKPWKKLSITANHPIIFALARRPAGCFIDIKGVDKVQVTNISCLYDLQFDHDGTYFANGVQIQSCSPKSAINPLPKELYYDQSLYSDDVVWDSYEQNIPLIARQLKQRAIDNKPHKRKRKTHAQGGVNVDVDVNVDVNVE